MKIFSWLSDFFLFRWLFGWMFHHDNSPNAQVLTPDEIMTPDDTDHDHHYYDYDDDDDDDDWDDDNDIDNELDEMEEWDEMDDGL